MLVLLNWVYAHYNNLIPVSNNVFFTFVVFGFIGGLSSAAFRAISLSNPPYTDEYTNLASPYNVMDPRGQVSATFISLGIGLLTGLVVGAILLTFNSEEANDYFHDNAYWNFYTNGLNKPTATP